MFAMSPLGIVTDWNLKAWTHLCPLYTIHCCSHGLEIGHTVPSTKPKQLSRAAPFPEMAAAYCSSNLGLSDSGVWTKPGPGPMGQPMGYPMGYLMGYPMGYPVGHPQNNFFFNKSKK